MERRRSSGTSADAAGAVFAARHRAGSEIHHVLPDPGRTHEERKTDRGRSGHRRDGLWLRGPDLPEEAYARRSRRNRGSQEGRKEALKVALALAARELAGAAPWAVRGARVWNRAFAEPGLAPPPETNRRR